MDEKEIKKVLKRLDNIKLPEKDKILMASANVISEGNKAFRIKSRAILVACVTVILLISTLTVGIFAIEEIEYNRAVEFFELNGLSTEGYSKREIKKICKDITDNSFTYSLTFEAICESLGIPNSDISQEEIKALWEKRNQEKAELNKTLVNGMHVSGKIADKGTSFVYQVDIAESYTLEDTFSVIAKYVDGELVWEKRFDGFSVSKIYEVGDRILVSGSAKTERTNLALMMLSQDGNMLWKSEIDTLKHIIIDEETITVIGNSRYKTLDLRGDNNSLYIESFDLDGNRLNYVLKDFSALGFPYVKYSDNLKTHDVNGNEIVAPAYTNPKYYVRQALKVEDEYYLILEGDFTMNASLHYMCVARVTVNGEYKAVYEVSGANKSYRITDIAVKNRELYICGYSLESENGVMDKGLLINTDGELDNIEVGLIEAGGQISNAELSDMLRAYYTGFVMNCDVESGELTEAKTVSGAKDGSFINNDGTLVYRYDSIADAKYETVTHDDHPLWPYFDPYATVDIVYKSNDIVIKKIKKQQLPSFK